MVKLRALQCVLLLLIVLSLAFSISACQGQVSGAVKYTPPFLPITFAIDTNGSISIQGAASLVTVIGDFTLEANASASLKPEDDVLLLIIRHKQNGSIIDTAYKISTGQDEVTVVVNGTTTIRVTKKSVLIDISKGNITSIDIKNAKSVNTPTTLTPQVPQTPTPISKPGPGTVLYLADQSHGWNGWQGSSDWKVFNGELLNDGTGNSGDPGPTIEAPYTVERTINYSVEARIRMVSTNDLYCFDPTTARGSSTANGWTGYKGTICFDHVSIKANGDELIKTDTPNNPGHAWHVYRLEVIGTQIKFFADDLLLLQAEDNRYLIAGQVGLRSAGTQLEVSSFKVIAL